VSRSPANDPIMPVSSPFVVWCSIIVAKEDVEDVGDIQMTTTFNVYCDESCHLENDRQPIMVLGVVWCPLERTREVSARLRVIKDQHGLPPAFEIKWTKVSPAKLAFYLDILDYFFDNDALHFRALVVQDKSRLRHELYGQDHETMNPKYWIGTMLREVV